MNKWWPYARLAAAVLGLAAIIRQFSLAVGNALAAETPWASHIPTVVANFFSYFTILSNLIAALRPHGHPRPRRLPHLSSPHRRRRPLSAPLPQPARTPRRATRR